MSGPAGVQLEQVVVRYPATAAARAAVDTLSLALGAGQIGVLIGPSGCGKTTVLRAVAGLEPLAAGRIAVGGEVMSDAASGGTWPLRRVASAWCSRTTPCSRTFRWRPTSPSVCAGSNAPRSTRGWHELLDLVGLAHTAHRAPHQLSGGQQQRIALARALAPRPQLLLLDEPFSSLDIDLRERLAQDVRAILKATGITALFVTHDQQEAFALGDRIGVMHAGRLEQWDDAYTLYHRPATRFVAGFIGHGVFTPARIESSASGPVVTTPSAR
jgi:iron(III) transport system ATP-binding protein